MFYVELPVVQNILAKRRCQSKGVVDNELPRNRD